MILVREDWVDEILPSSLEAFDLVDVFLHAFSSP
jgi:hypothetical protein